MIVSLVLLTFYFALAHGYWLGEPFESWSSIFMTLYLLICSWAFPYIHKDLLDWFYDDERDRTGLTLLQGMNFISYIVAPFIYMYLKYFDTKDETHVKNYQRNKQSELLKFSFRGLMIGGFLFIVTFAMFQTAWQGNLFDSYLSVIVAIYLGVSVLAFSYTLKSMNQVIDRLLDKPFGRVLLPFLYLVLYIISPLVFIGFKFYNSKS